VTAFEAVTGLIFEGVFIAMLTQRFLGGERKQLSRWCADHLLPPF